MALSDSDVQKQINHMMAFIEQEANEKAEEIDAKAEEEFNIEKGRLVQQQRLKIMEFFERKEKQVELQKKIQSSNMLNQSRLKVLKAREDHIKNVLEDARKQLTEVTRDTQRYQTVLKGLIAQALFQLIEGHVLLRCREVDVAIIEPLLDECSASYHEATNLQVQIKIDRDNHLSAESYGGVELSTQQGKIKVVNTLESRLEQITSQITPEIRMVLFGRNVNRRFTD